MAALCGTCSGLVLYPALGGLTSDGAAAGALAMLVIVAIIGGIPTMFGLWIASRGWREFQSAVKVSRSPKGGTTGGPGPGDPT